MIWQNCILPVLGIILKKPGQCNSYQNQYQVYDYCKSCDKNQLVVEVETVDRERLKKEDKQKYAQADTDI